MENFKIVSNGNGGFLVKADSERFGKEAIVFEGITYQECLAYVGKHNVEEAKKLDRRVANSARVKTYGKLDGVLVTDLMVGDKFIKYNGLISTVTSVKVRNKTTVVEYVYNFGKSDSSVYNNDKVVALMEFPH